MTRANPRYRPPLYKERNAARSLFGLGLTDAEIAKRVKASPTSVARWRRAWQDGSDPWPAPASSFGAITDAARRLRDP